MNAYILRSASGNDFKLRPTVPYTKGNRLLPFVNWSNNWYVFYRLEFMYLKRTVCKIYARHVNECKMNFIVSHHNGKTLDKT